MADDLLSQDEINALLEGTLGGSIGGGEASTPLTQPQLDSLDGMGKMFNDAVSGVVGMLAGRDVDVTVSEAGEIPQEDLAKSETDGKNLLFSVDCDGFDNAPVAMVMPELGVLMLADLMMGGEGKDLPEEANELFVNAAQEGLSQVVGAAMTSLSGALKGRKAMPSNPSAKMVEGEWLPFPSKGESISVWRAVMDVEIQGLSPFKAIVCVPSDSAAVFADALIGDPEPVAPPPAPPKQQAVSASSGGQPQARAPQPTAGYSAPSPPPQPQVDVRPAEFAPIVPSGGQQEPSNIGLIVDIPVRVTVELGRTRKTVGEVLSFAPGSVIELDKMAGEPVDVLVNGKLIAKGEVVVIDENFGVRVTEILNMGDRINSIGS
ncbi:MAG: flagellar motor switch protein FliN [Dethiosulfovibrio sp.]|nr:flagellar motor switch protein FliN [Dethiosulfovibrio sp.]